MTIRAAIDMPGTFSLAGKSKAPSPSLVEGAKSPQVCRSRSGLVVPEDAQSTPRRGPDRCHLGGAKRLGCQPQLMKEATLTGIKRLLQLINEALHFSSRRASGIVVIESKHSFRHDATPELLRVPMYASASAPYQQRNMRPTGG